MVNLYPLNLDRYPWFFRIQWDLQEAVYIVERKTQGLDIHRLIWLLSWWLISWETFRNHQASQNLSFLICTMDWRGNWWTKGLFWELSEITIYFTQHIPGVLKVSFSPPSLSSISDKCSFNYLLCPTELLLLTFFHHPVDETL